MGKIYYVYILSNASRMFYTGVTNHLERRVWQHREKLIKGFTARYNLTKLVYFESHGDIRAAIAREKQIKGWLRSKKVALIQSVNPQWKDLSAAWPAKSGKGRAGVDSGLFASPPCHPEGIRPGCLKDLSVCFGAPQLPGA